MSAAQMYYTSCESGLAGYPGFQFNAATPGVDPVVLRRVEQGTSYEPPRSIALQPTTEQIRQCPVNLCYLPGDEGEPAVLANTAFVGTDYSQRFGNYFVHALSLTSVEDDLGVALPIDFWRAEFWTSTEAGRPDLPELEPTPPPSSGPKHAEEFLENGPGRRGRMPQLVTAVDRAMTTGERSVVIVERSSEDVAAWIAAVSHLLPPAMARRMSFSTYSFRPGRNAEHVIGTVPDTDFTVDDSTVRGYFLFDFVGGRFTPVPAHPLAEMLTALNVQDGAQVWLLAEPLRSGAEQSLDDWYPLAVGGALRAALEVNRDDLGAVVEWLPQHAARLRPAVVAEIAHGCLDHAALDAGQATRLVGVAAAAGHQELLVTAEIKAFELLMREVDGGSAPAAVPRPATAGGTACAVDLITRRLNAARPGPHVVTLLTVAAQARLRLDPQALASWGRDLVTPVLLDGSDHRIPGLLGSLPDVRRAVLEALGDALPGGPAPVVAAVTRLAGAVPEGELASHPRLHRAVQLSRAARDPQDRVPALLRLSGPNPPDESTLCALWPDGWTIADAAEVAAGVRDPYWQSPGMVGRLDAVLRRGDSPRGASTWPQYRALCELATRPVLAGRLSEQSVRHVEEMRRAEETINRRTRAKASERKPVLLDLISQSQQAEGPAGRYLEGYLPQVLVKLDPALLSDLLPQVPRPIRDRFWPLVTEALQDKRADLDLAGALFEVRAGLAAKRRPTPDLDRVLSGAVAQWRTKDLDRLEKWLDQSPVTGAAAYYRQWREDNVRRGLGRFLPRRVARDRKG